MTFATKFTLEQRLSESKRIREKYPNRIPCIIERANVSKATIPDITKHKYLVPHDITMAAVMQIIRKRMGQSLKAEESLYMFVRTSDGEKTVIAPVTSTLSTLDDKYRHQDGFIYIEYAGENTFGC
ncbi:MAG: hypothetical protein CL454_00065 [Acidimicrobiaceae bacterium]|nr:hypothetical protein [Acidimicrobiaceae bacterium]|tara:strand:+ start:1799 stop:2176 length:378 start_codon:yes stop_codon:yes gene_type:complete